MAKSMAVKLGVALLLIAVAGVVLAFQLQKPKGTLEGAAFFYDLTSGDLFQGPYKSQPPITAPKGGPDKGVKAYVYACGECTPQTQKIGYLTNVTAESKAETTKPLDTRNSKVIEQGRLIALPPAQPGGQITWVAQSSAAGAQIMAAPRAACANALSECLPSGK